MDKVSIRRVVASPCSRGRHGGENSRLTDVIAGQQNSGQPCGCADNWRNRLRHAIADETSFICLLATKSAPAAALPTSRPSFHLRHRPTSSELCSRPMYFQRRDGCGGCSSVAESL